MAKSFALALVAIVCALALTHSLARACVISTSISSLSSSFNCSSINGTYYGCLVNITTLISNHSCTNQSLQTTSLEIIVNGPGDMNLQLTGIPIMYGFNFTAYNDAIINLAFDDGLYLYWDATFSTGLNSSLYVSVYPFIQLVNGTVTTNNATLGFANSAAYIVGNLEINDSVLYLGGGTLCGPNRLVPSAACAIGTANLNGATEVYQTGTFTHDTYANDFSAIFLTSSAPAYFTYLTMTPNATLQLRDVTVLDQYIYFLQSDYISRSGTVVVNWSELPSGSPVPFVFASHSLGADGEFSIVGVPDADFYSLTFTYLPLATHFRYTLANYTPTSFSSSSSSTFIPSSSSSSTISSSTTSSSTTSGAATSKLGSANVLLAFVALVTGFAVFIL